MLGFAPSATASYELPVPREHGPPPLDGARSWSQAAALLRSTRGLERTRRAYVGVAETTTTRGWCHALTYRCTMNADIGP